jgi:hypothetical protein
VSTGWVKVQLSEKHVLSGTEAAIRATCGSLFVAAGGPRDAALLVEKGAVRQSGRALYLSPVMAEICAAVVAPYNPVVTSPPKLKDVTVLFCRDDISRLLGA